MTTLFAALSKRLPRPLATIALAVTYLLCLSLTVVHLGYDGHEAIIYFDYGMRDE